MVQVAVQKSQKNTPEKSEKYSPTARILEAKSLFPTLIGRLPPCLGFWGLCSSSQPYAKERFVLGDMRNIAILIRISVVNHCSGDGDNDDDNGEDDDKDADEDDGEDENNNDALMLPRAFSRSQYSNEQSSFAKL